MVIIDASQALDPGSIPGRRSWPVFCCWTRNFLFVWGFKPGVRVSSASPSFAAIAQLGERQTEDLKVPGSIPGGGTSALVAQFGRAWV